MPRSGHNPSAGSTAAGDRGKVVKSNDCHSLRSLLIRLISLCPSGGAGEWPDRLTTAQHPCVHQAFPEMSAGTRSSVTRSVPLSVTMAEEIQALRKWASKRARNAAGDGVAVSSERRLSVAVE